MICKFCRAPDDWPGTGHGLCPELARQADPTLSKTIKAGSALCDCMHQTGPGHVNWRLVNGETRDGGTLAQPHEPVAADSGDAGGADRSAGGTAPRHSVPSQ